MFACWLLFMNEGWAIKTHQTLNEVRDLAISIPAKHVDHSNEGKLIHASHMISVEEPLVDELFGVSRHSVSLSRVVEMYQWVQHSEEHERKLSNGILGTGWPHLNTPVRRSGSHHYIHLQQGMELQHP